MNSERAHCQYEVCLSFAGEDREYVERVAEELRNRNIPVFYDRYEQVQLWGQNLLDRLTTVYMESARYCVMFVSAHYRAKVWPSHEGASALARALKDKEYLLPVRFDDTEIPGLLPTIGYVEARTKTPDQLADMIAEKLVRSRRDVYFPSNPVALVAALGTDTEDTETAEIGAALSFFESLKLMNPEERRVVFLFFEYACPAELPENLHINQDLLSRVTTMTVADLRQLLGAVSSLGLVTRERLGHGDGKSFGDKKMFELEWHDRRVGGVGNATYIASEAIWLVVEGKCVSCATEALVRLDFSALGRPRRDTVTENDEMGLEVDGGGI